MPSSWSASLRFELQFTGENINLWGDKLNVVLTHADYAIAGWLTKALTGDVALSTANAGDDEARAAMLKFTGAGPFTVTLPSVSKSYLVWNACAAAVTLTTGAGATAAVAPGERIALMCDGAGVYRVQGADFGGQRITSVADPTAAQDAATKAYADNLAFTANAGILPGQTGNAGSFLTTDGTVAGWAALTSSNIVGFSATASQVLAATSAATAVTPASLGAAAAEVTLVDGATIMPDLAAGRNFSVTLGGNRTLANPSNMAVGQSGVIRVIQDATGARTLSFGSYWRRDGGAPGLSTQAGATDFIAYQVISSTYIWYGFGKAPS